MTDYILILGSEVGVDAPVTASLMGRLSDNPKAIAEGAPGAPKIMPDAVQLVLGETVLNDVGNGITGISQRMTWVWVDFGFRYTSVGTNYVLSIEARFKIGAGAYSAWAAVMDAITIKANDVAMYSGGFWARPNTGAWRCTLGGKVGAAGAFDAMQLRLFVATGGGTPVLVDGRMMFTGLSSIA